MLPRLFCLLIALPIAACSGSPTQSRAQPEGVLKVFANAQQVTLVSLHPYPYELDSDTSLERLHGYGVLGRHELGDTLSANKVLALVEQGIEASRGMAVDCFNPRHGLTVTTADDAVWDIVICYECRSVQFYRDGEHDGGHRTARTVEPQVTAIFEAVGLSIHSDES